MVRESFSLLLVTGLLVTVANGAAVTTPSESLANVLKQRAQHVFDLSDKDHNDRLDRDEQADSETRMQKAFSLLSQANTLGGPRIPLKITEPQLADPDRMTALEFIQLFQARAARYDAQLRARRYAQNHPPAKPKTVSVAIASTSYANRQSRSDWRDRSEPNDRHDHASHHFHQQSTHRESSGYSQSSGHQAPRGGHHSERHAGKHECVKLHHSK